MSGFGLSDPVASLDGVTSAVGGTAIDTRKISGSTWFIKGAGGAVATVEIQASKDTAGTDGWSLVQTVPITANGLQNVVVDLAYPALRAAVTSYTSGTIDVDVNKWDGSR